MIAIHKQGEFTSFQQWVNKARSWIGGTGWICVDAKGRQCKIGAHMMLAEKEGAFPVSFGPPVVSRLVILPPQRGASPPTEILAPLRVQPSVSRFWGMDCEALRFYTQRGKERQTVALSVLDKYAEELAIEHCHLGRTGDLLFAGEAYRSPGDMGQLVAYKSDGWAGAVFPDAEVGWYHVQHGWLVIDVSRNKHGAQLGPLKYGPCWKPARTMPEKFARQRFKITGIRLAQRSTATWQSWIHQGFRCNAHILTDGCTEACADGIRREMALLSEADLGGRTSDGPAFDVQGNLLRDPWCWVLTVERLPTPVPSSGGFSSPSSASLGVSL